MKRGTYIYVLLLALDRVAAAILLNRPDVCISTLCWAVHFAATDWRATAALEAMNLYGWQRAFLSRIAAALEWIQPGHCVQSRQSDIETARNLLNLVSADK